MLKIGITGQAGFVGTHLFNTLGLYPAKFSRIPFEDEFFQDNLILENFVSKCDVVVHLAAMNRHNDPQVIYETNIGLVNKLIAACEATSAVPHILFSSSTQEERDNLYGKSKKEGRQLLENWALKTKLNSQGLLFPMFLARLEIHITIRLSLHSATNLHTTNNQKSKSTVK
jgi:UDP-2-acetamido-2,6-beta-L-arabino-hexul-4-ose reductase